MNDKDTFKISNIFKELQYNSNVFKAEKCIRLENSLGVDTPIIIKGLNAIIFQGIKKQASDIHIEPLKNYTRIRYRVDGILIEGEPIDKFFHNSLISRLKIISDLNITEKRIPQDGKFKINIENKNIDFRVSIIPLVLGEKAVIRILNRNNNHFELENLGFSADEYQQILEMINKKNGIILACGPTGSGKSSLIYAILKKINNGEVNISTIEDPVECEISGINQVQYNSEVGRDFSTILKSFLRQDPDILMIGEIRDLETAEIAIKTALTGHLVFSTLHTYDGISSIFRLLNIGIQPYMLSAGIVGIISQRLIRKLCPHCKTIDVNFLGKLSSLNFDVDRYKENIFYSGKGCPYCNYTGYLGRTAIFQIFIPNDEIKTAINERKTSQELIKIAKLYKLKSLKEIGVEKAISGITSLDEIMREC